LSQGKAREGINRIRAIGETMFTRKSPRKEQDERGVHVFKGARKAKRKKQKSPKKAEIDGPGRDIVGTLYPIKCGGEREKIQVGT